MQLQCDNFIIFVFYMLMRIRNNNNFSWWYLCNAPLQYVNDTNNMACYLGLSIHHKLLLNKINIKLSFNIIMNRTNKTLKLSGSFGISIFDNSQIMHKFKFQRGLKSSMVSLTTSRCVVKEKSSW